eukprot:150283-Rhodomonas_salina.3
MVCSTVLLRVNQTRAFLHRPHLLGETVRRPCGKMHIQNELLHFLVDTPHHPGRHRAQWRRKPAIAGTAGVANPLLQVQERGKPFLGGVDPRDAQQAQQVASVLPCHALLCLADSGSAHSGFSLGRQRKHLGLRLVQHAGPVHQQLQRITEHLHAPIPELAHCPSLSSHFLRLQSQQLQHKRRHFLGADCAGLGGAERDFEHLRCPLCSHVAFETPRHVARQLAILSGVGEHEIDLDAMHRQHAADRELLQLDVRGVEAVGLAQMLHHSLLVLAAHRSPMRVDQHEPFVHPIPMLWPHPTPTHAIHQLLSPSQVHSTVSAPERVGGRTMQQRQCVRQTRERANRTLQGVAGRVQRWRREGGRLPASGRERRLFARRARAVGRRFRGRRLRTARGERPGSGRRPLKARRACCQQ